VEAVNPESWLSGAQIEGASEARGRDVETTGAAATALIAGGEDRTKPRGLQQQTSRAVVAPARAV
jgi:hypothetical protein